ncbi:hypothetical protein HHK36_021875 [Tetracentron sinense]|uniref:Uncharacterized protein n=1 Tax=Tetracentron sinense TaxID=13715 RepID=A0A834YUF4_TETSI|nr:hypothetical protein HHK36_021875 [Tetracentron sinense]
MAYNGDTHQNLTQTHRSTSFRWPNRWIILTRRRNVPSIRLGGKKRRRRLYSPRIRLRWLKQRYTCMLKKMKDYSRSVMKDLMEASATLESVQQRVMMDAYFAVPGMGISFANFPA